MNPDNQHLERLQDIRQMMTRSSRFISLSGLSGVAAGICALIGAWFAYDTIGDYYAVSVIPGWHSEIRSTRGYGMLGEWDPLEARLFWIAVFTFLGAFVSAFFFTWLRSRKTGLPIWGFVARRLMWSVVVPMLVGGLLILRLLDFHAYGLIAPACLLFYGLALIHASKYTFPEIGYLGYGQLVLGALNLWYIGYGLIFWSLGFGVLHIVYGFLMWWKNERRGANE